MLGPGQKLDYVQHDAEEMTELQRTIGKLGCKQFPAQPNVGLAKAMSWLPSPGRFIVIDSAVLECTSNELS